MPSRNIMIALCAISFFYTLIMSFVYINVAGTNNFLTALTPLVALLPLLFSAIYISRPLSKLMKKWADISKNTLLSNYCQDCNEFTAIENTLSSYESKLTEALQELATLKEEIIATNNTCENSILQSKEASRLAEESRASNLLSASSKLENAVQRIMVAAGELSNRMESVSQGADVQTQRMIETSSSMGEMNLAISDISRSSSDASVSIVSAKEQARASAEIASKTMDAIAGVNKTSEILKVNMANLSEKAQGIDDIINVITEIADQTNLLALNAAIEAARAGDAGRGFAVVADEVRKLAEKTMSATKEVSDSIVSIQKAINDNVEQMNTAVTGANEAATMAESAGESAGLILNHIEENSSRNVLT